MCNLHSKTWGFQDETGLILVLSVEVIHKNSLSIDLILNQGLVFKTSKKRNKKPCWFRLEFCFLSLSVDYDDDQLLWVTRCCRLLMCKKCGWSFCMGSELLFCGYFVGWIFSLHTFTNIKERLSLNLSGQDTRLRM